MGLTPELLHRMKGECVRKGAEQVEERFALAEGRGEMVLTEEESRVRTWVRIPNDGRGLYKAYLLGRGGRFLLGTLVPEDGALALRRTVSRGELERRGFWPPSGGCAELAFSFQKSGAVQTAGWRREECPERLMGDVFLRRCAQALHGGLIRRTDEGFQLAFLWRDDAPFPLAPLFCFAVPEEMDGRMWAVFSFSGRGCPIMHRDGHKGNTSGVNH